MVLSAGYGISRRLFGGPGIPQTGVEGPFDHDRGQTGSFFFSREVGWNAMARPVRACARSVLSVRPTSRSDARRGGCRPPTIRKEGSPT